MKKGIVTAILFLITSVVFSQEWMSNYEKATAKAANEDKNIIMVFAGSDWCAPCIKLEKNILESNEFKKYAAEHWVLLKLDFPKRKQNKLSQEQQAHNDALAEKYNKKGYFPLVLVMNKNGEVLGETSFKDISPQSYIDELIAFEK
jgi:thioredoxin-related protein